MIPIRDHNRTRGFPIITILLITLNAGVFLYQTLAVPDSEVFFYTYGVVPCALTGRCQGIPGALPPWQTLFTAMFIHGGWLHIASNMLYLWIFGNNVEDAIGPIGFVVFYLLCGVLAGLVQVAVGPQATIATIGASGAIAGVLGAYFILFPTARVDTLVLWGFFVNIVALPAVLVLGGWFLLQVMSGFLEFGSRMSGGVAFFAHIGGFVAGMVLIGFFKRRGFRPLLYQ